MAHIRVYPHCTVIRIDSGEARGYNKQIVTSKPKRFVASAKARFATGGLPLSSPSAKYLDEVELQLDTIRGIALGGTLLTELHNANYNIVITFPEIQSAINHKCAGSSSATTRSGGTDLWRKPYDQDSKNAHLQAFQHAFQQAAHANYTAADIANEINAAIVATNNSGGGQSRAQPMTANHITDWMNGTQPLPSKEEIGFSYLLFAFERYLPAGSGNASRIRFDPWNSLLGTSQRPPMLGLYHELVHAWHNATGRKIFSDDDLENEMMTVGMPPFDQIALGGGARTQTENVFRPLLTLGPRTQL